MQFSELIAKRRSVRSYNNRPISESQLADILAAVQEAPSAGNQQSFEVVVVKDKHAIAKLGMSLSGRARFTNVPVVLVFLADSARAAARFGDRGNLYAIQDATIAATYAMLAIADAGLASVWIGAFDETAVATVVNAGDKRPIAMLPIAYGAESQARPPRRPGIVHNERL